MPYFFTPKPGLPRPPHTVTDIVARLRAAPPHVQAQAATIMRAPDVYPGPKLTRDGVRMDPIADFKGGFSGTGTYCVPTMLARIANVTYAAAERALRDCGARVARRSRRRNTRQIAGVFATTWAPMIEKLGWRNVYTPAFLSTERYTLGQVANSTKYGVGTYMVRITGHVLVLIDGKVYDNCNAGDPPAKCRASRPRARVEGIWKKGE